MDNTLKQRLVILEQAGQIDDKIIKTITELIIIVEKELDVRLTKDNGSMFVTHMAVALSRIQKGEEVVPLDDSLLEEVKSSEIYKIVQSLIEKIEDELQIRIPQSEFGYIALHLCNLSNMEE